MDKQEGVKRQKVEGVLPSNNEETQEPENPDNQPAEETVDLQEGHMEVAESVVSGIEQSEDPAGPASAGPSSAVEPVITMDELLSYLKEMEALLNIILSVSVQYRDNLESTLPIKTTNNPGTELRKIKEKVEELGK